MAYKLVFAYYILGIPIIGDGSVKIKIFNLEGEEGIEGLENRINDFILDKNMISIHQSESIGEDTYNLTITVMYEI